MFLYEFVWIKHPRTYGVIFDQFCCVLMKHTASFPLA